MVRDWMVTSARVELGAEDAFWAPCPMFHNATIGPMLASFLRGARFLSMRYFEPKAAIEMIEKEGATHLFRAFPTITMALLRHSEYEPSRFESGRLRSWSVVSPPSRVTTEILRRRRPRSTEMVGSTPATSASWIAAGG
jgi:fatty-acyl-CoA synthase